MSRPLVFATRNAHKVRELRPLLPGLDLIDVGEAARRLGRDIPDVDEDAPTFEGNAIKKALEIARATGLPALADDSGLEVDALDGAPGVHSARYAGAHGDSEANMTKLLEALQGVPRAQRTARFRCVLALADRDAVIATAHGTVEGVILDARRGTGGFGYDPVFLYPPLGQTLAEIPLETKSELSHRALAMQAIEPALRAHLGSAR